MWCTTITRRPLAALFLLALASGASSATPDTSTCYGTTSNGRLEHGAQLPASGPNFIGYGTVPKLAGRNYVHSTVREIILDAYHRLEQEQPGKVFKYGETGFENGGAFKPHKTHRNGLSADFFVPVLDKQGHSVQLPTHPFNRYGYGIEFDTTGRYENYRIDFEALAAHMVALHQAAQDKGVGIWRMIFDPRLAPSLYRTKYGPYLRAHIQIPDKASWVRHDEHFHVDFVVACKTPNKT